MALLDSEVARVRFELGYSNAVAGAYPYMAGIFASLGLILQKYIDFGATTTSATAVTAQPLGTAPQPVTLTLSSATGFSQSNRVVFDVDNRQESSIVESVSGSTIVVMSRLAHVGTYPVTVEGGESIVRELLRKLMAQQDLIDSAAKSAGVAKATTVEFFPSSAGKSKSRLEEAISYQSYLRNELARSLGVHNLNTGYNGSFQGGGGGGVSEMY